jgi:ATP-dependent Clp protease ATP-binding subunit ClpA
MPRELEMPRVELLDPTQNGRQAEHLENKLRHLVVGQDEAIHQIVRAYQTYLAGLSPAGRSALMFGREPEAAPAWAVAARAA